MTAKFSLRGLFTDFTMVHEYSVLLHVLNTITVKLPFLSTFIINIVVRVIERPVSVARLGSCVCKSRCGQSSIQCNWDMLEEKEQLRNNKH